MLCHQCPNGDSSDNVRWCNLVLVLHQEISCDIYWALPFGLFSGYFFQQSSFVYPHLQQKVQLRVSPFALLPVFGIGTDIVSRCLIAGENLINLKVCFLYVFVFGVEAFASWLPHYALSFDLILFANMIRSAWFLGILTIYVNLLMISLWKL